MIRLPSLRQLRYLATLADFGHFGRAAEACAVTQSTLSTGIRELEETLQAALVDRTNRRVVLTALGRDIAARARRVLAEAEEIARVAGEGRDPLSGPLRMGVIPTIGPFLLPRLLPRLRRRYARLRLYLTEDLTLRLLEQLHGGALDVALIALPFESGAIEAETLFDDRFLFACRGDDPLAAQTAVLPTAIASQPLLLLKDGHCLREHALSACKLGAPGHLEAFEATSLHTLVQMVDNGIGVTLLPQLAIDGGILRGTSLVVRPVAADSPARAITLVWRKGTQRREEFLLLANELRRLAADIAPSGAHPTRASDHRPKRDRKQSPAG